MWQGLLVKLENKLQRTGQDEIGWKNSNTILLYSLVLRDIDTFRFNQNRFDLKKVKIKVSKNFRKIFI